MNIRELWKDGRDMQPHERALYDARAFQIA
jgi:hypothetical protein